DLYGTLARSQSAADPVAALSDSRRRIESRRPTLPPGDPRAEVADWAAPALYTRVRRPHLFDPAAPPGELPPAGLGQIADALVDLDPGEFVGRRAELRRLIRDMKDGRNHGVVIHGIGGVGKSTLAVQLVRLLDDSRRTVVWQRGRATVDGILAAIARALR